MLDVTQHIDSDTIHNHGTAFAQSGYFTITIASRNLSADELKVFS
jgi:hypothetical protein